MPMAFTVPIAFTRIASTNPLRLYLLGTIACLVGGWGHFIIPSLLWQLGTWLGLAAIICCDTQTGRIYGRFVWAPVALMLNYTPMLLVLKTQGIPLETIARDYGHVYGAAVGCSLLLGLVAAALAYLLHLVLRFHGSNLICYAIGFGASLEVFDRLGLPVRPFSSELHASLFGWYALPFGLGLAYAAFFLLFACVLVTRLGWLILPLWFVPPMASPPSQPLPVIPIESLADWKKQSKKAIYVCGQGSLPNEIKATEFATWEAYAKTTGSTIVMEGEIEQSGEEQSVVLIISPDGAVVQPSFAGDGFIHAKGWLDAIDQIHREFTNPNISPPRPIKGFQGNVQFVFCYQNSQSWRFKKGRAHLVLNLGDLSLFEDKWVKIWLREQISRIQAQTHAQVVASNFNGVDYP